jgi:hypothetical protein
MERGKPALGLIRLLEAALIDMSLLDAESLKGSSKVPRRMKQKLLDYKGF